MGFATAHGQAMSALSALKKFGLVLDSNGRTVPTQRAIEIINLPGGDPRRVQAIRDAALEPSIYRELIEKHRETGWPSNDVLQAELIAYKNFNPNAVEGFVKDLRDTLDFAGLSELSELKSEPGKDDTVREALQSADTIPSRVAFHGSIKLNIPAPTRTYAFDISIPREVKGELKIVGPLGKDDLE